MAILNSRCVAETKLSEIAYPGKQKCTCNMTQSK